MPAEGPIVANVPVEETAAAPSNADPDIAAVPEDFARRYCSLLEVD